MFNVMPELKQKGARPSAHDFSVHKNNSYQQLEPILSQLTQICEQPQFFTYQHKLLYSLFNSATSIAPSAINNNPDYSIQPADLTNPALELLYKACAGTSSDSAESAPSLSSRSNSRQSASISLSSEELLQQENLDIEKMSLPLQAPLKAKRSYPTAESPKLSNSNRDTPQLDAHVNKLARLDHINQDDRKPQVKDIKDPDSEQSTTNTEPSKHLVKTIDDLPVFVTIENLRIASYFVGGEPYLCLPQLLRFIEPIFPLETIISTFEEFASSFAAASPKQVEGLVKASVLLNGAKSCPMIKRSDADRVCLVLYDRILAKQSPNGSSALCHTVANLLDKETGDNTSVRAIHGSNQEIQDSKSDGSQPTPSQDMKKQKTKKGETRTDARSEKSITDLDNDDSDKNSCHEDVSDTTLNRESKNDTIDAEANGQSSNSGTSNTDSCNPNEMSRRVKDELFDQAHNPILDLARAATSTLKIQIYHRCFGKCVGLYHPSLLKNSESACIECASCKVMLSPRRFVGHTHGKREMNVCHWGFNSYNWHHYIRLSRKQVVNNLDDDELLLQFRELRSAAEANNEPSEKKIDRRTSSVSREKKPTADVLGHSKVKLNQNDPKDAISCMVNCFKKTFQDQNSLAQGETLPLHLNQPIEFQDNRNCYLMAPTSKSVANALSSPVGRGPPLVVAPVDKNMYRPTCSISRPSDLSLPSTSRYQRYFSESCLDFSPQTNLCSGLSNNDISRLARDLTKTHAASLKYRSSQGSLDMNIPLGASIQADHTEIRREMFVTTSLISYMHSKGIRQDIAGDIASYAANLMRESKLII